MLRFVAQVSAQKAMASSEIFHSDMTSWEVTCHAINTEVRQKVLLSF